jgi:hypothetical protein
LFYLLAHLGATVAGLVKFKNFYVSTSPVVVDALLLAIYHQEPLAAFVLKDTPDLAVNRGPVEEAALAQTLAFATTHNCGNFGGHLASALLHQSFDAMTALFWKYVVHTRRVARGRSKEASAE